MRPVFEIKKDIAVDHVTRDTQVQHVDSGEDGRRSRDTQSNAAILEIQQLWRIRQSWHRAEKSLILQGKARCRAWTDGDKDAAGKLFEKAAKGEPIDETMTIVLDPFLEAIKHFKSRRKALEKRLEKLAKSLPVWPAVSQMRGFGPNNLAGVIGEAGNLSRYRTVSCLWKRMGLANINGERQGKRTDPDEALLHGYSPRRRSVSWVLGDTLSKAQLEAAEKSGTEYGRPKGPYGEDYVRRRERTAITHPDWTKAHSMNDARRIMTKSALRDLYLAWNLQVY